MHKMLLILIASFITTSTFAQDITSRDELVEYLKEKMPDGQVIQYTYKIGETFSALHRYGNCLSSNTLSRVNLVTRTLIQQELIDIQVTKEDTTYHFGRGLGIGGEDSPACKYKVVRFSSNRYDELGILTDRNVEQRAQTGLTEEEEDALGIETDEMVSITSITLPMVKQKLLGVQEVRLNGGLSIGGTRCDIAFVPWFENSSPSKFVQAFRKDFEEHYRYKNMFSSEYKASTWCFQRHYDDTWKWKKWSRL